MSQKTAAKVFADGDESIVDSLSTVKAVLNDQDFTLCAEQAFVQEINVQIRKLTQQIEDAKTRTNSFMKDNDEKGDEIRDTLQSKERLFYSIDLTRKCIINSDQQLRHYNAETEDWRQKYADALKKYNEKFSSLLQTLTVDLPLYQEVEKLKNEETKRNEDLKYMRNIIQQEREIKRKQYQTKKQEYNSDIVGFARICLNYNSHKQMSAQIKELEEVQKKTQSHYDELQQIKAKKEAEEPVSSCMMFFEENDAVEIPPISAISDTTIYNSPLDVYKGIYKPVNYDFKVPTRHIKRHAADFGSLSKRVADNNSKIKILNVQTVVPPNKYPGTSSNSQLSGNVIELTNSNQGSTKIQTNNSTVVNITIDKNILAANSQTNENKIAADANSGNSQTVLANVTQNKPNSQNIPQPDQVCKPVFSQDNADASFKEDYGLFLQTQPYANSQLDEGFNFGNTTGDDINMFNIASDVEMSSAFNGSDHEFVLSPPAANFSKEEPFEFFKTGDEKNIFKLF